MNEKHNVFTLCSALIFSGAIVAVFYLTIPRLDQYLKNRAVDECSGVSRYERTISDEGVHVFSPDNTVYKACLKDKGYK